MDLVKRLLTEGSLPLDLWQSLAELALQDKRYARAFDITSGNVQETLQARSQLLQAAYPEFQQFCQTRFYRSENLLPVLWHLWLPLALDLANRRQAQARPFVQGILGGQGTGKTTLGAILTLLLKHAGYQTLSLSLDDLYKTYRDRQLLRQQDPRLIWRGPPGTHDIELGVQVLDQLRHAVPGEMIAIPRFDKSLHGGAGDRTAPELVTPVDIVLFEGWFMGARPIDPALFDTAPLPITTEADRTFARDMNIRLYDYLPLWERLDSLMVLYPIDYRFSKQWRQQAEQEMRSPGKHGMNDNEIDKFVNYFWKALHPELFIKPLVETPGYVDRVIEIDQNHTPVTVYRGGDLIK
ncbi:glycerate kinase [Leptothermofonsia sichuanensis]|uniref:glycerate kinase n=1 Tax=Leptothermofonsia sichuanensis TaxID=2917832 RepID=UPI001CA62EF8|nr:glycerate kinase [Leptothermofonsia sichuanensis]